MAPVRVARAFRYSIIAAMTALALSGCMRRSAPVAVVQPQSDLDSLAYGQTTNSPPRSVYMSATSVAPSGGAIGALRASLAASPRRAYAPAPAVYATPMPVAYDAAYRLDAGDRLRIVIYGHEGLTHTHSIDARGSITMPLI